MASGQGSVDPMPSAISHQPSSVADLHRERRLGCREPGDRYSIRRSTDLIEADLVEEMNGRRIAAMFTAHAKLEIGTGLPAPLDTGSNQGAYAFGVDGREGILLENLFLLINPKELADIVPGKPERQLREVVGAKREELSLGGDLIGSLRAAWNLDHRADQVLDLDAGLFHDIGGHTIDHRLLVAQLLHVSNQRDHDLRNDLEPFLVQPARGFDDGPRLHLSVFRIGDAETDAAVAEHRVEFV